jgi:phosphate transport system permease protein
MGGGAPKAQIAGGMMRLSTRKLLDRAFTGVGVFAIAWMAVALAAILLPIFRRGAGAFVFRATIEHRRQMLELFNRGDEEALHREMEQAQAARQPLLDSIRAYQAAQAAQVDAAIAGVERMSRRPDFLGRRLERALQRLRALTGLNEQVDLLVRIEREIRLESLPETTVELDRILEIATRIASETRGYAEVMDGLRQLLGPLPDDRERVMPREQYGQARWDRALVKQRQLLFAETWDYTDGAAMGRIVRTPRKDQFAGTALYGLFEHVESNLEAMLRPRWTFYGRFLTDPSVDAHFFGGIGPETLGTFYLTIGAILFAVPLGIVAGIYFAEYARPGRVVSLLRSCVSTLAGVPSIVFGLFGLAFFINTIHVSPSKSVLAGALTLGLLVLPTVIRAAEEAILAVPRAYKEAAMALGAGRWRTVLTVILPAALPGILTGIVISMGRAAGETAPIIFTAAVSVGHGLNLLEVFRNPTPALSWNIYNLATEHEAVDEIRHVQYGMVTTLVALVLCLNLLAIWMRARVSRKLKG